MTEKMIVRCVTCNVEWDMDAEPAKCDNPEHFQSLNGGAPVDGECRPQP